MASRSRIERLRKHTLPVLDALPDRLVDPIVSDSDISGGVALETANVRSEQTAADTIQPAPEPPTVEANSDRRYVWLKEAESAYKPAPPTKTAITTTPPKPAAPLPATDLNRGDLGSATQHYTPIVALSKYPYKWCNKEHSQDIASAFFDQGKFWSREWDLYYVWDIDDHAKPLILVREAQVQQLLGAINDHLRLDLRVTDQQREEALVSRFPNHPRCTPRYLGRSHSREDYENMVEAAPDHDFRPAGEPRHPPLDDLSLEAFRQLMEESFEAQKAKSKAAKAKKQQERLLKQKALSDQFKRAQRYLGLRPGTAVNSSTSSGQPPAVDPAKPAPFAYDQSVVFVCVDVESYERAHHRITEVGIATLDTRELANVAPGVDGENWRSLIRARHFRIKENAHLVNTEFVQGCPDRFYFGESTLVSLAEAPAHVAACFSPPFGAHRSNGVESVLELLKGLDLDKRRNIIFLGHDTLGDVRYLQDLGFDPMKIDNLLEAQDTAVMYRVWRRELNPTNLGRILNDFDIAGHGLHNAGNDAVYTVQAMLAICVREATMRESSELESMRISEKSARLAAAVEDAQQKAKDEAAGWSDHEAEGDGGAPVPLSISPAKLAHANASAETQSNGNTRGASRGRGRGRGGSQAVQHSFEGAHNGYRGDRGRSSRGPPRGLRGYTRGGHVEHSSRARGRGRGRALSSTSSEADTQSPQVRYCW